jgi:hypothetical protein
MMSSPVGAVRGGQVQVTVSCRGVTDAATSRGFPYVVLPLQVPKTTISVT